MHRSLIVIVFGDYHSCTQIVDNDLFTSYLSNLILLVLVNQLMLASITLYLGDDVLPKINFKIRLCKNVNNTTIILGGFENRYYMIIL